MSPREKAARSYRGRRARSRSRVFPKSGRKKCLERFRTPHEGLTPARAGASLRAMPEHARHTIYALSSGRPPAAIAVVRISGSASGEALKTVIGKIPKPRTATLGRVRGIDGEIIDEALTLWFPAPHSETGEDVAELHCKVHGCDRAGTL